MKKKILSIFLSLALIFLAIPFTNISSVATNGDCSLYGHSFGEWETVQYVTCAQEGINRRTCEVCGETEEEIIPKKLDHAFDEQEYVPPTCTSDGYLIMRCWICGFTDTIEEYEATGHKDLNNNGLCDVCEETHKCSYNAIVTPPTCTEKGYTTYTCECSNSYVDNYIDAKGHTDNDNNSLCDDCGETIYKISGTCGNNLKWALDESTGTLIISGTGAMYNYKYKNRPWKDYEDSVKAVVIKNGVTTIGEHAFHGCKNLANITIPETVTEISGYAFYNCNAFTSITIPDTITTIGSYAFCYCTKLANLTICNGVTTIGENAFSNCYKLTSVIIPDSVTIIGKQAFNRCTSLTSITIPNSVKTIESYAFSFCESLTSIIIPDSVTAIGEHTFWSCTSLTSITIPNSVTIIGESAFDTCTSLTSITIPDSVTTIGGYAFWGCTSLTSITLGNGLKILDGSLFKDCTSLTNVTFSDNITTICSCVFEDCNSLKDVYYSGTKEQWDAISIYSFNSPLLNATIHYNYVDPNKFTGIKGNHFYKDGILQKAYQLVEFEGNYYFINDSHKLAKSKTIYLSARFVEGTPLEVGYYTFDADGKLIIQ